MIACIAADLLRFAYQVLYSVPEKPFHCQLLNNQLHLVYLYIGTLLVDALIQFQINHNFNELLFYLEGAQLVVVVICFLKYQNNNTLAKLVAAEKQLIITDPVEFQQSELLYIAEKLTEIRRYLKYLIDNQGCSKSDASLNAIHNALARLFTEVTKPK